MGAARRKVIACAAVLEEMLPVLLRRSPIARSVRALTFSHRVHGDALFRYSASLVYTPQSRVKDIRSDSFFLA
jgi:hypothetical protein